ncbi:hypothetical protein M514_27800, partial [Trichuris suis]
CHVVKAQRRKVRNVKPAGLLQTVALPVAPFEVLGIDHLGPFPLSKRGNRHVIVCVDYLTKWVELEAVPDTTAERVREFLIECMVTRHGVPKKIISDRGTAFTAECMRTALSSLGIAHGMVSACHPQANGLVERTNQTVSNVLSAYVDSKHNNWDELLPFTMFALNTAERSSMKISPFELVYGRLPILPKESCFPWPDDGNLPYEVFRERLEERRKEARRNCLLSQERQKKYYDGKRQTGPRFHVGQLVWLRRNVRQVEGVINETTYSIVPVKTRRRPCGHRKSTAHVSQLKAYVEQAKSEMRRRSGRSTSKEGERIVTR